MTDSEAKLFGGGGPIVAIVGGVVLVVVLVALAGGVVGVGGRDDQETSSPTAPSSSTTTAAATTAVPSTAAVVTGTTRVGDAPNDREVVLKDRTAEPYGSDAALVDALPNPTLLRVSAIGFAPGTKGTIEQCTTGGCANPFPVTFDEIGSARLQYLVGDAFAKTLEPASACRAGQPPCFVRVRNNERVAHLATVFHDAAPAPRHVSVEPGVKGLNERSRVRVSATGFIPGERVQAMLCVAPETSGSEYCGAPGPISPFTVGPDGSGRTTLVVRTGRVGTAGASCGRDVACGIVVSPATSPVPAPAVAVSFSAGPAARYEASRVAVGLLTAMVLLAIAFFLARTTDWRKPSEADTPELDRAVLLE